MRWEFNTPAGPVRGARAVDTSTHPGYRRLGVFSKLTAASLRQLSDDGVHLIFNTPNPHSMAGYLKLGWQSVGRPRLLMKVLNPLRMAAGLARPRARRITEAELGGFFRSAPRPVADLLAHGERVERILGLDDDLSARVIRTARTPGFLRWRYASAPSLSYFAHWTGREPSTGAVIFRPTFRRGLREIMLVELLVGYGAGPEMRELIGSLARSLRADYIVAAATSGTQHEGLLRRAGFVPLPQRFGPYFVVHPLHWPQGAPSPADLAHWRLSLGDLELF
jgi:hypothetical protein